MRIIFVRKFNIVRQSGLSDAGEGISLAISKFSKRAYDCYLLSITSFFDK